MPQLTAQMADLRRRSCLLSGQIAAQHSERQLSAGRILRSRCLFSQASVHSDRSSACLRYTPSLRRLQQPYISGLSQTLSAFSYTTHQQQQLTANAALHNQVSIATSRL